MDVKVKICGITNVEDAQIAVTSGADAVGFIFYEDSPRHVTIETAASIIACVSPFVMKVGVFVDPDPELVVAAVQRCGLNLLQFHGKESPDFCREFGVMSMKAFRIKDASSLDALGDYATDAYLLDSYVEGAGGGTGQKFNWDLAVEAKKFRRPIFLAGGLTPENVAEAVRRVQPFGVDVSSGVELSRGKKDHDKVRRFIAAAKGG